MKDRGLTGTFGADDETNGIAGDGVSIVST